MAQYIALIDGFEDAYGASLPDCPGCTAMGGSVDDVVADITAALREWVEDRVADGLAPPPPRSLTDLRYAEPEAFSSDTVAVLVPLLLDTGRLVPANVSLDADLLEQIDGAAKLRGLSRSAFLASAAREKILASR